MGWNEDRGVGISSKNQRQTACHAYIHPLPTLALVGSRYTIESLNPDGRCDRRGITGIRPGHADAITDRVRPGDVHIHGCPATMKLVPSNSDRDGE